MKERATSWNRRRLRRKLAFRYLSGEGIEIGALHQPQDLPPGTRVRYLDRLDLPSLRQEYPELDELPLVEVDIVEDGENPLSIPDESLDFIVASHMIEHCEDPLGTLVNWLRILRAGGRIFLVVPDRRRTFDRDRKPQEFEHLLEDYRDGPEGSRSRHYREWVSALDGEMDSEQVEREAAALEQQGYRIHFHVWTPTEFLAMTKLFSDEEGIPLGVVDLGRNFREFIVVLEKRIEPGSLTSPSVSD